MKNRIATGILFLVLFLSCNEPDTYKEAKTFGYDAFSARVKLTGRPVDLEGALDPWAIDFVDGNVLLLNKGTDSLVYLYSSEKKLIAKFLSKGTGPGELIAPIEFALDTAMQQLTVFDPTIKKLIQYTYTLQGGLPHFSVQRQVRLTNMGGLRTIAYGKEHYVGITLGNDQYFSEPPRYSTNGKRLIIYDTVGTVAGAIGSLPESSRHKGYGTREKPTIFRATLAHAPTMGKTVLAYEFTDVLEVYGNNGLLWRIHGPDQLFPNFKQYENHRPRPTERTRFAFRSIYTTPQGVYALYASEKVANTYKSEFDRIFFFDWQGNPMTVYQLDHPIKDFALHKRDIYGIGNDGKIYSFICLN